LPEDLRDRLREDLPEDLREDLRDLRDLRGNFDRLIPGVLR